MIYHANINQKKSGIATYINTGKVDSRGKIIRGTDIVYKGQSTTKT